MNRLIRSILLGGTVGAIASAGIIALLQYSPQGVTCGPNPGCPPSEQLLVESYQFQSLTNTTLNVSNYGSGTATLIAYYVSDPSANTFSDPYWHGPSVARNGHATLNIFIDGKAFVFQPGHSHGIRIVAQQGEYGMAIAPQG